MSQLALVLVSGGVDSAVLLYMLAECDIKTLALDFHFPGRLKSEARASENVARAARVVRFVRINLPFVDPPKEEFSAYIPKRNMMFYGIAATLAGQWDLDEIYGGHIHPDGRIFPDACKKYFNSLNNLISASASKDVRRCRIVTPLIEMGKKDVIELGRRLGVPFNLTWSCLRDGPRPCGFCSSCVKRRAAFAQAGMDDFLD